MAKQIKQSLVYKPKTKKKGKYKKNKNKHEK